MNDNVNNTDQDYLDESTWSDTYRDLTHERVRELFDYDTKQGLLIWKERPVEDFKTEGAWKMWNTRYPSEVFGSIKDNRPRGTFSPNKRRSGGVNCKTYYHHRLVWLYHNKKVPKVLDHIDQNSLNDRIENLRPSSPSHNRRNTKMHKSNTSGVTGVYWSKKSNKWCPQIAVKGKTINLGSFTNKEDAIKTRKEAELKYNFDPNHGK